MKIKQVKLRLSDQLHLKYKILCTQLGLSMAKQNAELIRKFVEVHEENIKHLMK